MRSPCPIQHVPPLPVPRGKEMERVELVAALISEAYPRVF